MEEFVKLKNELSDIITEKHKIDNLIDIILFKSKVIIIPKSRLSIISIDSPILDFPKALPVS